MLSQAVSSGVGLNIAECEMTTMTVCTFRIEEILTAISAKKIIVPSCLVGFCCSRRRWFMRQTSRPVCLLMFLKSYLFFCYFNFSSHSAVCCTNLFQFSSGLCDWFQLCIMNSLAKNPQPVWMLLCETAKELKYVAV